MAAIPSDSVPSDSVIHSWLTELKSIFTEPLFIITIHPQSVFSITTDQNNEGEDCLTFDITTSSENGPYIQLYVLNKCDQFSGRQLLLLIKQFAIAIHAHCIKLIDGSERCVNKSTVSCCIDYAAFTIMATGQSFYNLYGYQSKNHQSDILHNQTLIDDKPFNAMLQHYYSNYKQGNCPYKLTRILKRMDADVIDSLLLKSDEMCSSLFSDYDKNTTTTRELFGAIRKSNIIHSLTECDDPRMIWLSVVVYLFRLSIGGIQYSIKLIHKIRTQLGGTITHQCAPRMSRIRRICTKRARKTRAKMFTVNSSYQFA